MSGAIGSCDDQPRFTNSQRRDFEEKKKLEQEHLKRMEGRSLVLNWCTCDSCGLMETDTECFCCNESGKIGEIRNNNDLSRVSGYLAYSTFIKWLRAECSLGNEVSNLRYVVPACVVSKIRLQYPSETGRYVGYRTKFGHQTNYPA
ncbi:hypothetical protein B566_EDAN018727 [Ephemera danica]|nr:hypothetical protein B566_EDAN018727 [Ephemera danica]